VDNERIEGRAVFDPENGQYRVGIQSVTGQAIDRFGWYAHYVTRFQPCLRTANILPHLYHAIKIREEGEKRDERGEADARVAVAVVGASSSPLVPFLPFLPLYPFLPYFYSMNERFGKWFRRMGWAGFLFFLIKGLLWLIIPYLIAKGFLSK